MFEAVYSQGKHTKSQDRKKVTFDKLPNSKTFFEIKFECGRDHGLSIEETSVVVHIDEEADNVIKFVVTSVKSDTEYWPSIADKEGVKPNWFVESINDEPFSMGVMSLSFKICV